MPSPALFRRGACALAAVIGALLTGGCLAVKVVEAPVKLAATTVVVAGDVTGAAVKATGKVAESSFNAAGRVGSTSIESSARLAQAGMVTFVDAGTGAVVRVPWRQGMSLATAGAEARLTLADRALELIRGRSVVRAAAGSRLASGDVIRIGT